MIPKLAMGYWRWALAVTIALATAAFAQQQNAPRIGYISPAGAQQGTSFMVLVGGQYLEGTNNVLLSGDGIEAQVVEYFRPIRQNQTNGVRDKLKRLLDKKAQAEAKSDTAAGTAPAKPEENPAGGAKTSPPPRPAKVQWTANDEMQVSALRRKLLAALQGPAVPATAESVLVQITVSAEATPGRRELRLETPKGWTNPLGFCVGQFKEFSKAPPDLATIDAKPKPRSPSDPVIQPPGPPTNVTLPCVANGQIGPGGADRYSFEARKGQRLVIEAETRTLIPYISDAVPGWFQAALTLFDETGRELAYADHYLFDPEPVLLHEIASDGRYTIEIRDALYRGREDFVYRLIIGQLPYVTSAFPLGGRTGEKSTVELTGWNLPATTLTLDHRKDPPGIYPFSADKAGTSNVCPFAVNDLPECLEKESNSHSSEAQSVPLPILINGRIDKPDDRDIFAFQGKAGQEIVAEVYARRLRSPVDSLLTLFDPEGRQVARNDDYEDKAAGLETHHSDSYLRATLPSDGKYTLQLGDAQHKGGPEYAYRLRISPPQPDFDLRVAPSHIIAKAGASVPVTVFALRRDGFAGPINFALQNASEGLVLSGGPLPPDKDQIELSLKVLYWTGQEATPRIAVEGHSNQDGQEIRRLAVPSENMTQAFEYKHLVPASDLRMTVTGKVAPKISIKIVGSTPVKIPLGQAAHVKLTVSPAKYLEGTSIEWAGKPPQGIALEKFETSDDGMELVLSCDAKKTKAGQRGNLALVAATKTPSPQPASTDKRKQTNQSRLPPPKLPSIPFQIVAPQ